MPAPKSTREEFIRAWQQSGGKADAVAKMLDIPVRKVQERRRRIEASENVTLIAGGTLQRPGEVVRTRHDARLHLQVENGCVIVFSDAHYWPGIISAAHRALLLFVENLKPKIVVNNGDSLDGARISRYPRIGWDHRPTVIDELNVNKERLGEIEARVGPGCHLVHNLGNHDARFEVKLAAVAPEYEGVANFHLKDHFPRWLPAWSTWINNDVVCKHRFKGGVYAARNNALYAGMNIVTSHDHTLWAKPFTDYRGVRWGIDTGTLLDIWGPQTMDYTEDSPVDWQSGFQILWFKNNRFIGHEPVIVTEESTVFWRGETVTV